MTSDGGKRPVPLPTQAGLVQTRPDGFGRARGLVSSRKSGQRIESKTYAPSPSLAAVVDCFWSSAWNLVGQAPHHFEILTDSSVQVVFERGASRVVGVSTKLFRRTLIGEGLVRAVRIRPGAATALLPLDSVSVLTDQSVLLSKLFVGVASIERRVLAGSDEAGFAVVESWLKRECSTLSASAQLAVATLQRIRQQPALTLVQDVCKISGLSLRPLQRLFRDAVGASVKWVIRRERLREAAVELEKGSLVSVAELAARLGYADHSHFTRDFTNATGRAPSVFAREVWE